ncbi:methylated-DNA--[protein]-cysteine S-methyltransferase [Erwiniaceae bacterium L1_54_6]|jgi:methylated-DNA-[protein]-cysteine S-methyltransferase|uniref:Methylated-DNA--protein-cysteine methyltransferase n=1 Tax=Pantoea cypripedii TaxID=55209 RepID=A0A1X1ESA7_PANCY|nr:MULTISPECIES: methylated-DNA--[protein]-cysteine S-methyltransferase [Pantoea]MDF7657336.1 methylated-DNA--[protein]-cysteine S-methyltransferase [Erwiniaceae bacterium L1_54_6]MBP2196921.1 methylated-DNA-[protein]-cysteine S-methyltransferase [Pantoea cypripedii]MDE1188344.1 methylated-DNA--[protein]-cysteine S-methyltransferase [Pantoea sp.]ORM92871.1 methylated-DNA--protein-cysteine methyltransferase [Pantoea cypripedii]QGY28449.1 methylated-DNA--protein-cysteine methyltransferase [Panto
MYHAKIIPTPVGELTLIASNKGLSAILWENEGSQRIPLKPISRDDQHPILCETERQLREYFAGERQHFDLPYDTVGTEFQKKVWQALITIPFGETRSYRQIAEQIGNPKAVRAVGAANGKNPLSIVAPCHRVIGSNGKLTGFAGGLAVKAFLLDLEATPKS